MYYVYSEHTRSGKQNFLNVFDTKVEAVAFIRQCYNSDASHFCENEYYYFIKEH